MKRTFNEAIAHRRSYYLLDHHTQISSDQIQDVLRAALRDIPSAFNSQSTRLVLLTGQSHHDMWALVIETLREILPEEAFVQSRTKIETSFASGSGTVLFYEDMAVVESLQAQFSLYADRFPTWAEHTSAMHQFAIWTMLEDLGLGASLQHYNPLIDARLSARFAINPSWKLIAQMPFGNPVAEPQSKTHAPIEGRLLVF